jgi:uncharacterized protein (TIGR02757 family)
VRGPARLQRSVLDALPVSARAGVADPVFLVRRYADPLDQEVAGMIAALLAYGRVSAVCRTVAWVLDRLGPSPRAALLEQRHREPRWGAGFRYRFNTRRDLLALLDAMAGMLRREGSLGHALASRRREAGDLAGGLAAWIAELRAPAVRRAGRSPGLRFLLPDPRLGGACKRWWLYLRWMIRPDDGTDLGAWSGLFPASELRVPLDTHWVRIGPRLGMTSRRTPNARMAEEITDALRRIRPEDPLRYDYPVCHLGIGGGCPPRLEPAHCRACPLLPICRLGGSKVSRRRAPFAPP